VEVVDALVWLDVSDQIRDAFLDLLDGSGVRFAQQGFQLGECLLDRVQVGAIGRQEEQFGARRADRVPHGLALVTAQVIHHDQIAGTKVRYQELYDPGLKTLAVDRSIEHARSDDAIAAQTGDKGQRLAMTVRHLRDQALTFGATTMQSGHVGLRPGFIDEDQSSGGDLVLVLLPLPPPSRDVRAILFAGVQAFF
jgi:hypothetical protein